MNQAIFQILIIEDVIKVEFKITTEDGFNKLTEKIIETEAEYEQFKKELLFGIESLDDIMKQAIGSKDKACLVSTIKDNNNGNQGSNASDVRKAEHQHAPVQ